MTKGRPVTLITGGTGGLGRALSKRLASEGHLVVVNFRSAHAQAQEMEKGSGERCHIFKADVSIMSDVQKMSEYVGATFGKLDNLINNAGISRDGLLLQYKESEWDDIINTNLRGSFNCVKTMLPLMKKSDRGHVINISSYSGLKGKAGQAAYSVSKAGLIGMSRALAKELSDLRIRVNVVLPGYMETPMGMAAKKAMDGARRESLLNTLSDPDEVAGFISYLCSTRNITGQVFSLDSRIM